jgi:hypothetical protein
MTADDVTYADGLMVYPGVMADDVSWPDGSVICSGTSASFGWLRGTG